MNKTILITGTSSGIGRASALLFAEKGWNVIATMRKKEDGAYFSKYQNVLVTELDVTKQATIDNSLKEGISRFGKIDILLNNAGWGVYGIFEEASEEIIRKQLEVNLLGVMRTIKSILPHFRKEQEGLILNVTSVGGRIALPYLSLYYTSKWGVEGLSEALKFELEPLGIGVKVIEPGIVNTKFGEKSYDFSTHSIKEYGAICDKVSEVCFQLSGSHASESKEVAKIIYEAATDESPQFRYPAGPDVEAVLKAREKLCDEDFFSLMKSIIG